MTNCMLPYPERNKKDGLNILIENDQEYSTNEAKNVVYQEIFQKKINRN